MKTQQQNPCDKNIFAKHINNVHCTYSARFFKRANTIFLISMNLISISSIKLVHGMSNRCQTLISFCSRWFHQLRQIAMRPNFRFYSALHKKTWYFFHSLFSVPNIFHDFSIKLQRFIPNTYTLLFISSNHFALLSVIKWPLHDSIFNKFFSLSRYFFRNNVNEKNSIELSNK